MAVRLNENSDIVKTVKEGLKKTGGYCPCRLERTEENLTRIGDKISELELQVVPLREQAEEAKKYLLLRDELRTLEISVWLENLDALKSAARKLETDFHAAQTARDEARTTLDALYAEGEQFGERMRAKDLESESIRAEAASLTGKVTEQESAVAVLESAIVHNEENIQRVRRELEETDSRAGGLQRQAEEQESRMAEIDRALASLNSGWRRSDEMPRLWARLASASPRQSTTSSMMSCTSGSRKASMAFSSSWRRASRAVRPTSTRFSRFWAPASSSADTSSVKETVRFTTWPSSATTMMMACHGESDTSVI